MDSTSPPEAVEPVIQDSPIFDPTLFYVLPMIINNLDPRAFVRLARTCKDMYHYCFTNKEIQIPCWNEETDSRDLVMNVNKDGSYGYRIRRSSTGSIFSSEAMKRLHWMPFVYTLKKLEINGTVNEGLLTALRRWMKMTFPRVRIQECYMTRLESDWEGMAEFVQDAGAVKLNTWIHHTEASRNVLSFLTQNLTFFLYGHHVEDDIILRATAKELFIYIATISKNTFKELIKKFIAGDISRWAIGREPVEDFIDAVSEEMETIEVEEIDVNAMKPSVIYFTPARPELFFLLKTDGSLNSFTVRPNYVEFGN